MNYGYMRMSTGKQDGNGQRQTITEYAARTGTRIDEWISETISSRKKLQDRQIAELIGRLQPGDAIITSELSRLARSMPELYAIIYQIRERGGRVVFADGGMGIEEIGAEDNVQTNAVVFALSIGAQIERQMISDRTRAALKAKKERGEPMGRPRGPGKSKLDAKRDEIERMLSVGMSAREIARRFKMQPATVTNFLKKREIVPEELRAEAMRKLQRIEQRTPEATRRAEQLEREARRKTGQLFEEGGAE